MCEYFSYTATVFKESHNACINIIGHYQSNAVVSDEYYHKLF